MSLSLQRKSVFVLSSAFALAGLGGFAQEADANASLMAVPSALSHPSFASHWYDGQAEVASYDVSVDRYQERREGTAVLIFVTETTSNAKRVKVDTVTSGSADQFPVMKLNFILDFPTGVYDYNVMQSTFVSLAAAAGVSVGAVTKATFSSQEWCGHVFEQFVPRGGRVEHSVQSYFEDEEKKETTLEAPTGGVFGDALFHWSRGFTGPNVAAGEERVAKLLTTSMENRFRHKDPRWETATFGVDARSKEVAWEGGKMRVHRKWVRPQSGGLAEFFVEEAFPHRLVRWTFSGGTLVAQDARLVSAVRNKYWALNGKDGVKALTSLKLKARPPRTP
jgi:hypothetical protein